MRSSIQTSAFMVWPSLAEVSQCAVVPQQWHLAPAGGTSRDARAFSSRLRQEPPLPPLLITCDLPPTQPGQYGTP
jgi:hypothetical protein